jgi:hypothetical protein
LELRNGSRRNIYSLILGENMDDIKFVLMILAVVCFFLATVGYNKPEKINTLALGLLFWAITLLI